MRTEIVNAWRAVRARPVVSAVVVGTLAVALGATTAIFSVVNGVLLRPLPYPEADRLVQLWQTNTPWLRFDNPQLRAFAVRFPLSLPTYGDWEEQLEGVESMGAYGGTSVRYGGPEYVEVLRGARVTSGFFRTLAVEPHLGRWFTPEEDAPGAPSVVVLSHETWTERFGADRDLLGRTITLDARAHTVVGVMPPGFGFPSPGLDVWRSLSDEEKSEDRDSQFLNVIARLGDDATLVSVRSTLEAVQARLGETYPDEQAPHGEAFGGRVEPALDYLVRDVRSTLWFLLGSVALVLAVACVNIANILSVEGLSRRRELAIRASLGASRGQLVRGLLAEAALLAVLGGVLGTALAAASLPLILRALPPVIPRLGSVSIDAGVLLFGLAVTAMAALVSGAFPAVQSAGVAPGQAMSEASRGVAGGRTVTRVRSALVVGEVALSFVLLVGAALLGVSYRQLVTVERGFVSEGLAFVRLELDPDEFPEPEDRQRFVAELGRAFRSIPGVTGVSATNQAPLSGSVSSTSFTLERGDGEDAEVNVLISSVVPGYFDVMGIRVTRGRPFTKADPPVRRWRS